MKKIFVLILVIGMMLGLMNTVYAVYPDFVTVNSYLNGCNTYPDSIGDDKCGPSESYDAVSHYFDASDYTFSVYSGGYKTSNYPDVYVSDVALLPFKYFWSVNIYDPEAGVDIAHLGSRTDFFNDEADIPTYSVTINLPTARTLYFYAKDEKPRDNIGDMTMSVSVVPEPISSILFIVGGSTLAARRFMRRKKIDRQ